MRAAEDFVLGTLAIIGFGSFVTASLVVGARLLAIAMRTGKAPELAIGAAFFGGGGCGYGLIVVAYALRVLPEAVVPIAVLVGNTAASFGAIALAFGVWRIFRAADRWPLLLIAAIVVPLALSLGGRLMDIARLPASTFVFWTFTAGSCASYAWSTYESLRFHAMLRRRMRIGLADANLARRFLLWGIAGGGAVGIHVCAAANRFVDANGIHPALLLAQAVFGLAAAIGIWLAFFPPRRARNERAASA